jgi:L-rhamnonate dehydratase
MAVVQIETDEGIVGHGWCEDGCQATAPVIENHLQRLLLDQDPQDVEGLWDRLFRATLPYGRKGSVLLAISAIDTRHNDHTYFNRTHPKSWRLQLQFGVK